MHSLELQDITKRFTLGEVLSSITLSIEEGQRVAVVGESGSGKTTLLRVIAGLELPSEGRIKINGQDVTAWAANRRGVGLVFQDYATYPRLTVAENLGVSLVGNGLTKADKDSRLAEIVGWLGLEGMLKRLPTELSGGQLQRVALGKTLMARPKLLLLDEPFSQLDVRLAEQMRRLLNECHVRYGMTQVMVTHQPLDALCCVDKLAVLDRGKLVHFDTPDNIRRQPKTLFAAELTSPCGLNVLPSAALPGLGFDLQSKLAFRPEAVRVSDAPGVAPVQPIVPFKCRLGAIKDLGIVKLREAYVDEHKIWIVCASAVSEPASGAMQAIEGDQLQCWISRADLMVFAE